MSAASAVRPVRAGARAAAHPASPATPAGPAARTTGERSAATRIRLVAPPASSRRRLPFGVLCGVVVALALAAVLLLNISLSHGSYEMHSISSEQARLDEQRQALAEQLEQAGTPERLAARAQRLGMVPADSPAFLHLPDGAVLGDPQPATAPPEPDPTQTSDDTETGDVAGTAGTDGTQP